MKNYIFLLLATSTLFGPCFSDTAWAGKTPPDSPRDECHKGSVTKGAPKVDKPEEKKETVSTVMTLLHLPVELLAMIGDHSGNTLALKSTCRVLNTVPFKTKKSRFVLRHSKEFQDMLRSMAAGVYELSPLNLNDDVTCLNLYNLTAADFARLLPDRASVSTFLDASRQNRVRPVKKIILRRGDPEDNDGALDGSYMPFPSEVIDESEKRGLELYFLYDRWNTRIDQFFSLTPLSEEDFLTLLKMTSFQRDLNALFEGQKRPSACLAQYIRESRMTTDPAYLQHVLRTHREIISDNVSFGLTHFSHRCMPYVWGLLDTENTSNGVNVLANIRDIHKLQLCFGVALFNNYDCPNDASNGTYSITNDIEKISHMDTPKILKILRSFIPHYIESDYFDLPEVPCHGFLKILRGNLSTPYEDGGVSVEESEINARENIFIDFAKALGTFDKKEQLIRLKRLMQVLDISHLRPIECSDVSDSGYTFYGKGFTPCFARAMGYLFDQTASLSEHEFTEFTKYLKAKNPSFNPLFIMSEKEFQAIWDTYKESSDPSTEL